MIEDGRSRIAIFHPPSSILGFFEQAEKNSMAEWKFDHVAGPFKGATEGPAWDGKKILFSVPAENRILSYDPLSGAIAEFRRFTIALRAWRSRRMDYSMAVRAAR